MLKHFLCRVKMSSAANSTEPKNAQAWWKVLFLKLKVLRFTVSLEIFK